MRFIALMLCITGMTTGVVSAQEGPMGLKFSRVGHRVNLEWNNPDMESTALFESGFEAALPQEGWSVRTTNTEDSILTWFSFPHPKFTSLGNWQDYIHTGEKSMMVYFDFIRTEHKKHQDEWLISPTLDKAAYLSFYSFIDPAILEFAMDPEYPCHYAVVVSKDNGLTWGEPIWDAREDASPEMGWQEVVLALDEEPTADMRFAFRAYGDFRTDENGDTVNEGLNFLWVVDDVKVHASQPLSQPAAKMPVTLSYQVEMDGDILAEKVRALSYTDKRAKEAGKHIYKVIAVNEDGLGLSDSVEVELPELPFAAPRKVVCSLEPDEMDEGYYTLNVKWEAPEGDFQPSYYNVYCDEEIIAYEYTELEYGMMGCGKGIYEMCVEAVYQTPDGVSAPVCQTVMIDVRHGVGDLKAEADGMDVKLSWNAPVASEHPMGTYTIWRAGKKVAEGVEEISYTDKAVKNGYYRYTVAAVYADGEEGLYATVDLQVGEEKREALPYGQKFGGTFCPENIRLANLSETPEKYSTWYFDDGSRLGVEGLGFDGGYAAIDCEEAGFYPVDAVMQLPAIHLPDTFDCSLLTLSFYYSYASGGEDRAGVEWSVDGEEWYLLKEVESYDPWEVDEFDFQIKKSKTVIGENPEIRSFIEQAGVIYLRFHYEATYAYHFAVDNIVVSDTSEWTRPEEPVAVEDKGRDAGVSVSAVNGLLKIESERPVVKVEVYAFDGTRMDFRKGNGGTQITMMAKRRGPAIVRVTTQTGVYTKKVLL